MKVFEIYSHFSLFFVAKFSIFIPLIFYFLFYLFGGCFNFSLFFYAEFSSFLPLTFFILFGGCGWDCQLHARHVAGARGSGHGEAIRLAELKHARVGGQHVAHDPANAFALAIPVQGAEMTKQKQKKNESTKGKKEKKAKEKIKWKREKLKKKKG